MITARLFILAMAIALVTGCTERDDMKQGARLKTFESASGNTHLLATDLVPLGTVARDDSPFDPSPRPPTTLALLTRGRVRFDTFCAPCHARDGYGDGIIVRHGFPRPPSLHDDPVRAHPDEHYFDVIVRGLGKMPPYGTEVPTADRWAIVAYIRALQLSQNGPPDAVPAPESLGNPSEPR